MALSVLNNVASLGAQKALTKASNMHAKTLERLSSGLRINHASDDASGLAISEKLRGQISGLKRASMNAQDGISYLQAAEGGMEAVTGMLQRMREIAVQAGNGIYTTNDRAVLQLEVDQLKEEINRISRSTEFNTKKLLDGSGTALWSSTSDSIGAIIRGPDTAEGNYKIETSLNPGTNSQYKTNIMSVKNGVLVAEVTGATGNLASVRDPRNINITGTALLTFNVTSGAAARTSANTTTNILTNMNTFQQNGANWRVSSALLTTGIATSGYFEVEMLSNGATSSGFTYRYRALNSVTGKLSNWINATATNAATATITINGLNSGLGSGTITLRLPFGAEVKAGDKIFSPFSKEKTAQAGTATYTQSGGGTIAVVGGPMIDYSAAGSLTKVNNGDFKVDYNEVTVHMGALDKKTGVVNYGSLTLEFQEVTAAATATPGAGMTITGTTTVNVRDTGTATKDTRLSDLKQFVNADGVNILTNTQELKIYAGGKSAVIYFEADDTIEDFENKLTSALVEQLGLGADDTTSSGQSVNQNLVNFVPNLHATDGSNESVAGTFIIQTAKLGSDSDLVFIGDQSLVNALGVSQIKQGQNSTMDVKVTDAHTGKFIGSDNLGDGRLRSVINGVEVVIKYDTGVQYTWDSAAKTMNFAADTTKSASFLHILNNRTELQIGANQGQTMNISVGQLDTTGLEIDDVYVMDMQLSQKAITKLDKALERLNSSRSTIGAQANRLEYAMNNLETARTNLTSAESRIRDLDMAEETSKMSQYQVLVQAATAMVAQANQVPQQALTLLKG